MTNIWSDPECRKIMDEYNRAEINLHEQRFPGYVGEGRNMRLVHNSREPDYHRARILLCEEFQRKCTTLNLADLREWFEHAIKMGKTELQIAVKQKEWDAKKTIDPEIEAAWRTGQLPF